MTFILYVQHVHGEKMYPGSIACSTKGIRNLQVVRAAYFSGLDTAISYTRVPLSIGSGHWRTSRTKILACGRLSRCSMWMQALGNRSCSEGQLVRAAHILPVFDSIFAETDLTFDQTLDKFKLFYVNKFIDHSSNFSSAS
jgi:hypothetical protein